MNNRLHFYEEKVMFCFSYVYAGIKKTATQFQAVWSSSRISAHFEYVTHPTQEKAKRKAFHV
jgi:hypothetical protein